MSSGLFHALRQRLAARPDSEHGQALIRIEIFVGLTLAIAFAYAQGWVGLGVFHDSMLIGLTGTAIGLVLFLLILRYPARSDVRRVAGMATDYGMMTAAMIMHGRPLAWLYVIMMWVTVGNGLRYGSRYLVGAVSVTCACFGLVLAVDDYWRQNLALGIGLWLGLAAVPMYLSGLLKQLTAATAEARRASEAKSRFLANMSHEFRTPLNGLSGMTSLLATTRLDEEQRECVATIQASARSLLALVEEVLDISAIEAGKLRVQASDFPLSDVLDAIDRILGSQALSKGISYAQHVQRGLPETLHGDPNHLRQILVNLVGNAVKFTERGDVSLAVSSVSRDEGRVLLRFVVEDTGIGVPPEMRAKLFDAFEQADTGLNRRYEGTGLGTTIAKGLAEQMGGRIGYEPNQPQGSRFWVELPFQVGTALPATDDAPREIPVAGNVIAFDDPFLRHRARVRSMRILVADDHEANRMVLERLLRKAGHACECVVSAEDALDVLAESDFDAAVIDLHMPGMSGLEMLKQLRVMQAGSGARTPVLVLSADVTPEAIRDCEQAGAYAFLAKPVSVARLLEALSELAANRRLPPSKMADDPKRRPSLGAPGGFDPAVLKELSELGLGKTFEQEFVRQCLDDAFRALAGIEREGNAGNWLEMREQAHALKGVAGNLGLVAVASRAGELMHLPDWQCAPEWRLRMVNIRDDLGRGREAIHAWRREREARPDEQSGPA